MGSGRSAGYAVGEGRTSPRLGAMAGIRNGHVPGRLHARAWLPVPVGLTGGLVRFVLAGLPCHLWLSGIAQSFNYTGAVLLYTGVCAVLLYRLCLLYVL